MQVLNVTQGSDQWYEARRSVMFTASEFDNIITAKTGAKSASVEKLTNKKIAELLLNRKLGFDGNAATERGQELEPDAIDCYAIAKDTEVLNAGFVIADDGFYGASPDGFIGNYGLLEIKSVFDESHVANMLNDKAYLDYYPQLQGQLLCTGRKWVDWMSYHPELPPVIIRVERDEKYIAKLKQYLNEAKELLETKKQKLKIMGYL